MGSSHFVLASTCLPLLFVSVALGSDADALKPGDRIKCFLHRVTCDRLPIEFYGLHLTIPFVPSANPPSAQDFDYDAKPRRDWPSRLTNNRCSDSARTELAKALVAVPPSSPKAIYPNYCIIYKEPEGPNTVLWIDSSAKRMVLCVAGQASPFDIADIADPRADTISGALLTFLEVAEKPYNDIKDMQEAIENRKLPAELMSIDPKSVEDVFKQKHWNVLGNKLVIGGDADWKNMRRALNRAFYKDRQPAFAADDFRPQLALSAKVASHQYVLLMSYESRLAEIYVDGQSHGCYAISPGWVPRTDEKRLAFDISSDQLLCDILAAAKQPLKPKSTSSGN